jgi:ABC-type multidrug transport system permease subunit
MKKIQVLLLILNAMVIVSLLGCIIAIVYGSNFIVKINSAIFVFSLLLLSVERLVSLSTNNKFDNTDSESLQQVQIEAQYQNYV